jgi:hypothetical protein
MVWLLLPRWLVADQCCIVRRRLVVVSGICVGVAGLVVLVGNVFSRLVFVVRVVVLFLVQGNYGYVCIYLYNNIT